MRPLFTTSFALIAFAFNSILCRLALGSNSIDESSFTSLRLISGALTLLAIYYFASSGKSENPEFGNWRSAVLLFVYAMGFSFAYGGLTTGTGALILFGTVQATMILYSILIGQRPEIFDWLGLILALAGLVYLVFPGLESPPIFSSGLMAIAGVGWGLYTLRGKKSKDPLAETTGNFVRTIPFVLLACIPFLFQINVSAKGILLAVLSGSVASGIGYVVWYAALKYHTAARAAVLQLSVPLIAAAGGVFIVEENLPARLPLATVLILGGILATIVTRRRQIVVDSA